MEKREAKFGAKLSREIVVVLHNIRSLHNVGSIFRTADGAGVKKIYLCGITPAPFDGLGRIRPQLAKVSLGAEKNVPWDASARSAQATLKLLEKFKKDGYNIFAVEQAKNSIPYYRIKSPAFAEASAGRQASGVKKVALVLGNEVQGLPLSVLKLSDKILEIPMRGAVVRQVHHPRRAGRGKESLNVSVAFGIVVYHLKFF